MCTSGLKLVEVLLNLTGGLGALGQENESGELKLASGIETAIAYAVSNEFEHPLLSVTVEPGTKFPWRNM